MEQVKQTFRCSLSLSPSWQLLRLNQFLRQETFLFLGLIKLMKERMGTDVVLFQDFIIVRSVELLFFIFQVLRKQSEAKEWIVIIWRVVHYENVERVLISTDTSSSPCATWSISIHVCSIPEGRSAVALNQQPFSNCSLVYKRWKLMWETVGENGE